MIYKYTKCESVIAKIMADADLTEKSMRVTDIREWIFEAIEKIGAPMQYIDRESGEDGVPIFKICDYQIPLPDDLTSLTAVGYSAREEGPFVPARSNTSSFKGNDHGKHRYHHEHQPMHYKPITSQSQLWGVNLSTAYEKIMHDGHFEEPTYFIKPGWIVLNKKEGYAKLAYKAIAVDERGYPLIPDLASYQEAVYWYVMMKLNFPKFLSGSLGGRAKFNYNVYTYLQQQWNFYRNQAYAEAMMPTEGDMRSIKNEWNKLVPDYEADSVFFESVGRKQLNYNDYYNGY